MTGDADDDHSRSGGAAAETAPLLLGEATRPPQRPSHRASHSVTSVASSSLPKNLHVPKVHKGSTIVNFLNVIILVSTSAGGFIDTPIVRLLEDTFCRDYYAAGPGEQIDEKLCKVNSIQTQVQDVMSITIMLMSIVGLFSALPWGLAADRFGRRPIVFIVLMGIVIGTLIQMAVLRFHEVFPIRLIWASAATVAIGGGTPVLLAITFSIVTDATAEKDRAIAFMRIHVASMCGNLISPALCSLMMQRTGPWPCIWVGNSLLILSAVLFLFLPETLQHKQHQEVVGAETESQGLTARIKHSLVRFKDSLSLLKTVPLLLLMLATLVAMPIPYATLYFMVQYMSKRYGIKLAQTGYVQSVYGTLQLIQAFVILPWVSKVLLSSALPGKAPPAPTPGNANQREHHLEHRRDLTLLRSSGVFLVVGFLILGLASTLPGFIFGLIILALGSAYNSITRSIMSLYVDPEHTSRLFTLVGMVEVAGNTYGPPFIAVLFDLGLGLGGRWIGLPYIGLSVMVVLSVALLMFVRLPGQEKQPEPAAERVDEPGE